MTVEQHLAVRRGITLCGNALYRYDSVRERTWVTCIKCQQIIAGYHPDMDPTRLFAHPRI